MAKGKIKTIIADKGFGFITPDNANPGDKDIFFHFSGLAGGLRLESLHPDDVVEYETAQGPKGINATNVRLAESEEMVDESSMEDVDAVADETEEVAEVEETDEESAEEPKKVLDFPHATEEDVGRGRRRYARSCINLKSKERALQCRALFISLFIDYSFFLVFLALDFAFETVFFSTFAFVTFTSGSTGVLFFASIAFKT